MNPCYNNNFGCEEQCLTRNGRGYCACGEGKILLPDGKRCGGKHLAIFPSIVSIGNPHLFKKEVDIKFEISIHPSILFSVYPEFLV